MLNGPTIAAIAAYIIFGTNAVEKVVQSIFCEPPKSHVYCAEVDSSLAIRYIEQGDLLRAGAHVNSFFRETGRVPEGLIFLVD
ncbi:MAG: hypothetical protein ABH817_00790 [archaeon]